MTGSSKLSLLNQPGLEDSLQPGYRSMRFDPMVWKDWEKLTESDIKRIKELISGETLNPGKFALFLLNPELLSQGYPNSKLTTNFLEDCMTEFQLFLQNSQPPSDLIQAAKMMVVLLEKRKITPNWTAVITELSSRFHDRESELFLAKWKTTFGLLVNIVNDQEDLVLSFCNGQSGRNFERMLLPVIMMLSQPDSERVSLIVKYLVLLDTDQQAELLREFLFIGESGFSTKLALRLIENYKGIDTSPENAEAHWNLPDGNLTNSCLYQTIAKIAEIAGDVEFANKLLTKTDEILKAALTGVQLQKLNTNKEIQIGEPFTVNLVSENESSINMEMCYNNRIQWQEFSRGSHNSAGIIKQSKVMSIAGNDEIALSTLTQDYKKNPAKFISGLKDTKPNFNLTWEPVQAAQDMMEIGALLPAEELLSSLLNQNPTNQSAVSCAIQLYKTKSDWNSIIPLLEGRVFFGHPSVEDLRDLVKSYTNIGEDEKSFKISRSLISIPESTIDEKNNHALLALKIGKTNIARETINEVLAVDPENSSALCTSGKTFIQEGDLENAKSVLNNAIDRETEKADPWIALSEIYINQSDNQAALSVLQSGLVALPKNRELKLRLARALFDNGSTAEALPLLNEIRCEFPDAESSLLLLRSVKNLHLEEFDELVTELFKEYPDNPEISYEFAAQCLRNGDYHNSTRILKGLLGNKKAVPDWVITYADAAVGLDPKWARKSTSVTEIELNQVLRELNNHLEDLPDNSKGQLLHAEILLQKGLIEEAHGILSRLLDNNSGDEKIRMERIQTWFAWTAATLGKFDVALASIRDVVDAEPQWIGAQQVMAEIIAMTDNIQAAMEQTERVLDLAPEIADNQLWVGDFYSRLGEDEKAEKVLFDGAQLDPDDVRFDLALTTLYTRLGKDDLARPLLEGLKQRILKVTDERVFTVAAEFLEESGESGSVEEVLSQRLIEDKKIQNTFDLAGYYYQHGRFENALTILESLAVTHEHAFIVNCLKADTFLRVAGYNQALELIESLENNPDDNLTLIPTGFIPLEWIQIVNCKSPVLEVKMRINFEIGEVEQAFKTVIEARSVDSGSGLINLIGLESSLALGRQDWSENEIDLKKIDQFDPWYELLAAQQIGHCLDSDHIDEAWEKFNNLDKCSRSSSLMKVIETNLLLLEGNTSEAEDLFDKILESDLLKSSRPLFEQAGIYRLMIKTAVRLSRWNEALAWAHEIGKRIPWHQTINNLYLTILVSSLEHGEIYKTIDSMIHSPEESISHLDVNEEFDWLKQNTDTDDLQERWLMRGSLAYQPTRENIKALALLKPTPEDAAAIIAALRKVDQISTALQLGKKYPAEPAVLIQIALCQSGKDLDASISTLDSMIGINNTNPVALRLRAEYHMKAGHSDLAVNDLESALQLWQNELKWHKTAGELWAKLGNDEKAVQHWQFAYEKSSDDFDASLNLAKGLVAIGENEKAISLLMELTKNNPNQADLWETLTDAYLAAGKTSAALETAGKASELNPFSVKPYLLRAKASLDRGNIGGALLEVEKADQQVKNSPDVKIFIAKLQIKKGNKAAALAALEDATRCENLSPKIILEEIKLIREINGNASAKNLIEYFSQQMPENVELLSMLAESQLENGEDHAAELTARRALKIAPESSNLLIFLGKEQVKKGQLDQAIHTFSQVIKLHSDYLEAYFHLGEVYEKQREYSKAIDIMKQVIDKKPGNIQAYLILVDLFKNAKNYRLAEEMLKRAVDLDPKNVSIKRQLGALLALNLVHQSQEVSSQL